MILLRALVLSGGGAKGSYQIGVWKALRRLHISYDLVTGTSVGALNGALMVQNDYRLAKKLWKTLNLEYLFQEIPKKNTNLEVFKLYQENFLKNGGMDVSKIEEIIKHSIHLYQFYHSKIDYGLVTFDLTTKKAKQLTKREIPQAQLCDYLMASATCYPAFQMKEIDGEKYIDGGFSDNLPMNLAVKMGADELIVVDLKAPGIKKKMKKDIPITYITPSQSISFFLNFNEKEAKRNMQLGYNDTMKAFKRFEGQQFTFRKRTLKKAFQTYRAPLEEMIRQVFEKRKISIKGSPLQKVKNETQFEELFWTLTEEAGTILKVDPIPIYRFRKFKKELKKAFVEEDKEIGKQFKKEFQEKNFKKLLNTRWITFYLYQKLKQGRWKEIQALSLIFQKDLLRAIYFYVVIQNG